MFSERHLGLLCPAILMIAKASTPSRSSRVNMVCRNECTTKCSGSFRRFRALALAANRGRNPAIAAQIVGQSRMQINTR